MLPQRFAVCARLSPIALNASPEGNYGGAESLCRETGQISPAYLSCLPDPDGAEKKEAVQKPSRKRRTLEPESQSI